MHPAFGIRILTISCLAAILGCSFFTVSCVIGTAGVCALLAVVRGRRRLALFLLIGAAAGIISSATARAHNGQIRREWESVYGSSGTVIGRIVKEPDLRIDRQQLTLQVDAYAAGRNQTRSLRGYVLVSTYLHPAYVYGDRLTIRCRMEQPDAADDFDYRQYLELNQTYGICGFSDILEVSEHHGQPVIGFVMGIKASVLAAINRALGEPHASLLAGLLLGSKQGLTDNRADQFRQAGLTHILVVSGYNITIIGAGIFAVTQRWIGRKRSFWLVLGVLTLFAIMVGAQASVIRATLMGVIALLAKQSGRTSQIGNTLLVAACAMALYRPDIVRYDVGYHLSFAATIGLVYGGEMLAGINRRLPAWGGLRDVAMSTLAASSATLPIILWNFGQVSLVAFPLNIVILPLIPGIMGFGFITTLATLAYVPAGMFAGGIVWLGETFIFTAVERATQLPVAAIQLSTISRRWGAVFMVLAWILVWLMYKKNKKSRTETAI